jgi:hypothetical protein
MVLLKAVDKGVRQILYGNAEKKGDADEARKWKLEIVERQDADLREGKDLG